MRRRSTRNHWFPGGGKASSDSASNGWYDDPSTPKERTMRTPGYGEGEARRLVPLLRSIVREICERRAKIEELEPQEARRLGACVNSHL